MKTTKEMIEVMQHFVNEGDYRVVEASNIRMIENIVVTKLLDTYVIKI